MQTIQVDPDVYAFLQEQAIPFVDDPNSVLRRLLLVSRSPKAKGEEVVKERSVKGRRVANGFERDNASNENYVQRVLKEKFSGRFRRVAGYRMMFETDSDIVYFHNFSKSNGENLWYRLNAQPLAVMRSNSKQKWICFTNPADNYGFLIPLDEIDRRVKTSGWYREDREVNIHVSEARWRELDWLLESYRFALNN